MKRIVQSLVLTGSLVISSGAWAQESTQSSSASSTSAPSKASKSRGKEKRAFRLGVCVGQALAAEGVDVQAMEAAKSEVDEATKQVLASAVTSCREQLTTDGQADSSVGAE